VGGGWGGGGVGGWGVGGVGLWVGGGGGVLCGLWVGGGVVIVCSQSRRMGGQGRTGGAVSRRAI